MSSIWVVYYVRVHGTGIERAFTTENAAWAWVDKNGGAWSYRVEETELYNISLGEANGNDA